MLTSQQPVVNPMLGPSSSALIQMGARFPPCMKNVTDVPITTLLPCKLLSRCTPTYAPHAIAGRFERHRESCDRALLAREHLWVWRVPR